MKIQGSSTTRQFAHVLVNAFINLGNAECAGNVHKTTQAPALMCRAMGNMDVYISNRVW